MSESFNEKFDLLVIGGGITGCGVARDAAMRGLSVALVERDDFASGTSGRSSRLVHGGIRYLEHAQFHLVRESIRERETLLRIAPHLVKPLAFTWPIYSGARVGRLKLDAGLFLYQLLGLGKAKRYSSLDTAKTLEREPALGNTGLTGGAVYYDARTDDARLTIANALAAEQNGAVVASHTRVTEIIREAGKAVGAIVTAQLTGERRQIRARAIVSAIGVWPDSFGSAGASRQGRGSKGVHIAVPRERVGNRDAITIISVVDGRVMFCLPAGSQTIIGTTDTWTDESPEMVHASAGDVEYLLRSANAYFPRARLTFDDVVSAWAGIRPLATGGSNPTAVSREHSIVTDGSGIIHVTGGKLTTYRSMAAEVVDRAQESLGQKVRSAATDIVELPGGDRDAVIAEFQRTDPALSQSLVEGLTYTAAHLVYGVTIEKAQTLSDLLIRRTHLAFETRDHGRSVAGRAAEIVAPLLGWDEKTKSARVQQYEEDVGRIFAISAG